MFLFVWKGSELLVLVTGSRGSGISVSTWKEVGLWGSLANSRALEGWWALPSQRDGCMENKKLEMGTFWETQTLEKSRWAGGRKLLGGWRREKTGRLWDDQIQ